MQDQGDAKLLQAPVTKQLLKMTGPIGAAMLATFLFQVVDTYFVGQIGPGELAALGFSATAYFLAVALFMGVAVGVSSLVANAIGQGDHELGRRYATLAAGVAVGIAALLSAAGLFTIAPLFGLLGAGADLLPLIETYMGTLYWGMPLLVFGLAGDAAIRATGDVTSTAIIMGLAGVVNLVLDYLLIFGIGPFPAMELEGAALATVISWVFVFLGIFPILLKRRLLTLRMRDSAALLRNIVKLSTPAVATQIMLPLTAMFIVFLAAKSGPDVVAAIGVATRIETLLLVGISSVCVAIVPFIAQNHGAQKTGRVEEAIVFSGKFSTYWGLALVIILVSLAEPTARIFSSDPEIVHYTKLYFYIVSASYGAYGVVSVTSAIFNGMMKPGEALKVLLVKTLIFAVPLATLGSFFGASGIFAAIAASNALGFFYATKLMRRSFRDENSALQSRVPLNDYVSDLRRVAHRG